MQFSPPELEMRPSNGPPASRSRSVKDSASTVGQAVQGGRGHQGIAEQIRPLAGRPIAGDQDRAAFVAFENDIQQILGARRTDGLEAEVI